MERLVHDPDDGVYPTDGDWVHAVEIRSPGRLLFVSGTMGLSPRGVPGATLEEQLDLVWSNISRILGSAAMGLDDVIRVTSYLRDESYAEANAAVRVAALGGRAVATRAVVVRTLQEDWLVEIEVIAAD